MAKNETGTGSFPTMGTSAAQLSSASRAMRGRLVPKGGPTGGAYPEANKSDRTNVLERQGATLHPVISHVKQNDPNASFTGRNVYTLPSSSSYTSSFQTSRARAYTG